MGAIVKEDSKAYAPDGEGSAAAGGAPVPTPAPAPAHAPGHALAHTHEFALALAPAPAPAYASMPVSAQGGAQGQSAGGFAGAGAPAGEFIAHALEAMAGSGGGGSSAARNGVVFKLSRGLAIIHECSASYYRQPAKLRARVTNGQTMTSLATAFRKTLGLGVGVPAAHVWAGVKFASLGGDAIVAIAAAAFNNADVVSELEHTKVVKLLARMQGSRISERGYSAKDETMRWPTNVTDAVAWVGGKNDALRYVVPQSAHAQGDVDGEVHIVFGREILARLMQVVSAAAVRTTDGVSSMLASSFDYDGKHDSGEPFDVVFSQLIKTVVVMGVLPVAPSERLASSLSQAHGRLVFCGETEIVIEPASSRGGGGGASAASATAPLAQPVPTRKRAPIAAAAAGGPASASKPFLGSCYRCGGHGHRAADMPMPPPPMAAAPPGPAAVGARPKPGGQDALTAATHPMAWSVALAAVALT